MKRILSIASLLAAAVMLISCSGNNGDDGGSVSNKTLKLVSDKNLIQTFGGDYATLTLTLDGQPVTEDVTFFDGKNNIIEIPDFKFSTDKAGEYEIWANYGTYNSEKILIRAISVDIPPTPTDPKPESTAFKVRTLVSEFTTLGCSYCPNMKLMLHKAFEDEAFADKLVVTECHTGLVNSVADPCYIDTGFDESLGVGNFPNLNLDMFLNFNNYNDREGFLSAVNDLIAAKEEVAAGISVTSVYTDGQIVIKATVKAAEDGAYRLGAMLLEDGVYGKQTGGSAQSWMDNHDGVVRHIDSKVYIAGKEMYLGFPVGSLKKGETGEYLFVWSLDEIWSSKAAQGIGGGVAWADYVLENLHVAVFATSQDQNGDYFVNNVIDCPINGVTPFEYK